MKNFLIIGYGFVGKATEYAFTAGEVRKDINFRIMDPILFPVAFIEKQTDYTEFDAIFICVPTPPLDDGACDDALVMDYIERIASSAKDALVIVRSTVPPSSIKKMLEINPHLVYFPEFLRERSWQSDVINPAMLVIGSNYKLDDCAVRELINLSKIRLTSVTPINSVTPFEASVIKYAHNTFLASKIVFMHEIFKWLDKTYDKDRVDWNRVSNVLNSDPALGNSHTTVPGLHGLGYAGSCFPKDVGALITESRGSGFNQLLNYVQYRNSTLQQDSNEL